MTAASAAPFYLPSACFPDGSPPSCGGDPFQRHKSPNVVGQVLQANFGARSPDANRAYDAAAQRGLLSCEHVLDAGANFASVVVGIRLRFRQRALASGPHMNTALEAAGVQSLLDCARVIGAVAEHVRRRVALSQEFVQLLAVVHRRSGHLVAPVSLCLASAFTWFLYPKKLLPCLFVQRASRSFWRNFAGLLSHSSGIRPAFTASFSSRLLRCVGTGTIVASTICPPRAM